MGDGHRHGRLGEERAAHHLEGEGWTILARNWRDGPRELDLVAWRDGVLAVVEVKTRGSDAFGSPFEAITRRKRRELEAAARAWLRLEAPSAPPIREIRFDAVAVRIRHGRAAVLEHLVDAWRAGDSY